MPKQEKDSEKTCIKKTILLVHGMGFRDSKKLNYWGRIRQYDFETGVRKSKGVPDRGCCSYL